MEERRRRNSSVNHRKGGSRHRNSHSEHRRREMSDRREVTHRREATGRREISDRRERIEHRRPEGVHRSAQDRASSRLNRIRQRRILARRRFLIVGFIAVAFCIVMGVQLIQKVNTLNDLKQQQAQLKEKLDHEKEIADELKEQEEYVQTDDYVEEMARKLGLLYPNEVIFKPQE